MFSRVLRVFPVRRQPKKELKHVHLTPIFRRGFANFPVADSSSDRGEWSRTFCTNEMKKS
jgi:hypothetical protein